MTSDGRTMQERVPRGFVLYAQINQKLSTLEAQLSERKRLGGELASVEDELVKAKEGLAYLKARLKEEEDDVAALDKWYNAFSRLLPGHEAKVDKEVREALDARARVELATQRLQEADAGFAAARQAHSALEGTDAMHQVALGQKEALLRRNGHPVISQVDLLEAEAEILEEGLANFDEALNAAQGVLAGLGGVQRSLDKAKAASQMDVFTNAEFVTDHVKYTNMMDARGKMEGVSARMDRLQAALGALDLTFSGGKQQISMDAIHRDTMSGGLGDVRSYQAVVKAVNDAESTRFEVSGLLDHLVPARRQLHDRLEAISTERTQAIREVKGTG